MKLRAVLCCLAASGLLLSACSEDGGTIDEPTEEAATSAAAEEEVDAEAFDPPMQFDTGAGVPLPEEAGAGNVNLAGDAVKPLPVVLSGTRAFIAAANQLQIVDTRNAEVLPAIVPQSGTPMDPALTVFAGDNPIQAPITVDVGGKELVVVPFLTTGEASGTAVARQSLEVIAVDPASGEQAFSVVHELPLAEDGSTYENAVAKGATDGVVVIDLDIYTGYSVAVDLNAKAVAWEQAFSTWAVAGDTVVGNLGERDYNRHFGGLAIADGAVKWDDPNFGYETVGPAGSKYVYGFGGFDNIDGGLYLVEAATGKVTSLQPEERDLGVCRFDGQTTLVCNDTWGWLGAVNTETGQFVWQQEASAERASVGITAVWHGAIYGSTENGPVVLDALTGADAETAPGVAPWVVNEYAALAADPNSGVSAYPAIA
ncbi:hypothetical protein O1R50_18675 [Glycomyces luteolus]|uniref:PQQ-like domain-containing protein n=1 Tax=Glycomyces luteolus TaxID=2670330 RepID=A0A9X3PBH3_9ACTN|nr:hypothetical protein [Glycomyces luteolus]MDA1361659.1 hypothetical protein [Glycomyces luteolus]